MKDLLFELRQFRGLLQAALCILGICAALTSNADERDEVWDTVTYDFAGRSAQGWRAHQGPECIDKGISAVRPGGRSGRTWLELDVDLDASQPDRRSGEALVSLHGEVAEIQLSLWVPNRWDFSSDSPPGVQVFLRDGGHSFYSTWRNIGRGAPQSYPVRAGRWNRIVVKVAPSRGEQFDADRAATQLCDTKNVTLLGVKISLPGMAAGTAQLKDTFAISDVVIRCRLAARDQESSLDVEPREADPLD